MEIKNLEKVADRIKKAIENKEKIILFGDSDLDGVTSVITLREAINNLGGRNSALYFSNREKEGYGLSRTALVFFKKEFGKLKKILLIVLDCGIGNFKEAKLAKRMGFELIIVDHHEPLGKIPEASIVVDPKQPRDKYPFKGLSACGIVFRLACLLFDGKMPESLRKNFVELACLSTLADMMPKEEENVAFIREGMRLLEKSWRPGLRAILDSPFLKDLSGEIEGKIQRLISLLNTRDVRRGLPISFKLLTLPSSAGGKMMIEDLVERGKQKRGEIKNILEEIEARIEEKKEAIIFEGDKEWDSILISAVASILVQKHKKPVFLFKDLGKESLGTVRNPSEVNGVCLMKKCQKLLITFGGHPKASGFRLKNENLEKFKECLIKNL
ncbi:MAG: DHH family phosphoesterase [bacterium]